MVERLRMDDRGLSAILSIFDDEKIPGEYFEILFVIFTSIIMGAIFVRRQNYESYTKSGPS
jgi:hypothetical protein